MDVKQDNDKRSMYMSALEYARRRIARGDSNDMQMACLNTQE